MDSTGHSVMALFTESSNLLASGLKTWTTLYQFTVSTWRYYNLPLSCAAITQKAKQLTTKQPKVATCYLLKIISKKYCILMNKVFLRMHPNNYFSKTFLCKIIFSLTFIINIFVVKSIVIEKISKNRFWASFHWCQLKLD